MALLLDSDGLIKLNRAGVLEYVVKTFTCIIPESVYDEVVTQGLVRRYEDALAIEATLAGSAEIVPAEASLSEESGLGRGERAILGLLSRYSAPVVVSDDRRFLTVLSAERSRFLTPADLLVLLARMHILTAPQTREALDRMRPLIRAAGYWQAVADLEAQEGGSDAKN